MSMCRDRHPKLSVAVLNHNYARFLPECLDSILRQTFTDFELIVIDDCSSDDSLAVLQAYLHDPRVRLVAHERNEGFVQSLIEGTEIYSRGELLTVLSADDFVRRVDAFERQVATFEADENVVLCFSAYESTQGKTGGSFKVHRSFGHDIVVDGLDFTKRYLADPKVEVLHSGCMFRQSAYQACGGYRRDLKFAIDFALWPSLALQGSVAYCAHALYCYRYHEGQMSQSSAATSLALGEVLDAIDGSCAIAAGRGVGVRSLKRVATQQKLLEFAVDHAFAGRSRSALGACATALALSPIHAATCRRLWIVLAHLVLGRRGFELARCGWAQAALSILHRVKGTSPSSGAEQSA